MCGKVLWWRGWCCDCIDEGMGKNSPLIRPVGASVRGPIDQMLRRDPEPARPNRSGMMSDLSDMSEALGKIGFLGLLTNLTIMLLLFLGNY